MHNLTHSSFSLIVMSARHQHLPNPSAEDLWARAELCTAYLQSFESSRWVITKSPLLFEMRRFISVRWSLCRFVDFLNSVSYLILAKWAIFRERHGVPPSLLPCRHARSSNESTLRNVLQIIIILIILHKRKKRVCLPLFWGHDSIKRSPSWQSFHAIVKEGGPTVIMGSSEWWGASSAWGRPIVGGRCNPHRSHRWASLISSTVFCHTTFVCCWWLRCLPFISRYCLTSMQHNPGPYPSCP